MLATTLWRNGSDRSFQNLEQCLLHALAGDVPRYAWVFRLAGDLVNLVDIDDAALAFSDVEVTSLQQPDENVLDVFAHVASFRQRRGIGDRERHVQNTREGLREQRLADARRTDEQDVRLIQLYVVVTHRR